MYLNFASIREIKKYMDRRPKMAKILEVNTIKGSAVIDRIAGMLSKANRISVISITINLFKYKRILRIKIVFVTLQHLKCGIQ